MRKKDIKSKVKQHFLEYPSSKLRVREIERNLKLPLPSVIRYCKELEQEGILTILKIGSTKFYTSDKTNDKYLLEKRLYNIRKIYESGLVEYLKTELSNPGIILFGSYSRGEDTEESDIDIYLETPSKRKVNLEKYERLLRKNIQIFQETNLNNIKNPHLANNIIRGIMLSGRIEAFT